MEQEERKSALGLPALAAIVSHLWQEGGVLFVFISSWLASVDFAMRLLHNAASRDSGEQHPCVH
jgi:hypothetical protein